MTQIRLDRRDLGFGSFPYYQVRVDMEEFHGLAGMLYLTDGKKEYTKFEKNGKTQMAGKGMFWLTLIPDHANVVLCARYVPEKKKIREVKYPYALEVFTCDVMDRFVYAEDDLTVEYTKSFLSLTITPKKDVVVSGASALSEAFNAKQITAQEYETVLYRAKEMETAYATDYETTELWCNHILANVLSLTEKYPECRIH